MILIVNIKFTWLFVAILYNLHKDCVSVNTENKEALAY